MKNLKCLFSNIYSFLKEVSFQEQMKGRGAFVEATKAAPVEAEKKPTPESEDTSVEGKEVVADARAQAEELDSKAVLREKYLKPIGGPNAWGGYDVDFGKDKRAEQTVRLRDLFTCPYLEVRNKIAKRMADGNYFFANGKRAKIFTGYHVQPYTEPEPEWEKIFEAGKKLATKRESSKARKARARGQLVDLGAVEHKPVLVAFDEAYDKTVGPQIDKIIKGKELKLWNLDDWKKIHNLLIEKDGEYHSDAYIAHYAKPERGGVTPVAVDVATPAAPAAVAVEKAPAEESDLIDARAQAEELESKAAMREKYLEPYGPEGHLGYTVDFGDDEDVGLRDLFNSDYVGVEGGVNKGGLRAAKKGADGNYFFANGKKAEIYSGYHVESYTEPEPEWEKDFATAKPKRGNVTPAGSGAVAKAPAEESDLIDAEQPDAVTETPEEQLDEAKAEAAFINAAEEVNPELITECSYEDFIKDFKEGEDLYEQTDWVSMLEREGYSAGPPAAAPAVAKVENADYDIFLNPAPERPGFQFDYATGDYYKPVQQAAPVEEVDPLDSVEEYDPYEQSEFDQAGANIGLQKSLGDYREFKEEFGLASQSSDHEVWEGSLLAAGYGEPAEGETPLVEGDENEMLASNRSNK